MLHNDARVNSMWVQLCLFFRVIAGEGGNGLCADVGRGSCAGFPEAGSRGRVCDGREKSRPLQGAGEAGWRVAGEVLRACLSHFRALAVMPACGIIVLLRAATLRLNVVNGSQEFYFIPWPDQFGSYDGD